MLTYEEYCEIIDGQFLVGNRGAIAKLAGIAWARELEVLAAVEWVACWLGLGPAMSRDEAIAQARVNLMRAEMVLETV